MVLGLSGACKYVEYESRRGAAIGGMTARVQTVERHEQWRCGRLPLGGAVGAQCCVKPGEPRLSDAALCLYL